MSGSTIETLRQRHAELVKRIHGTKLILTGNKLRAAHCAVCGTKQSYAGKRFTNIKPADELQPNPSLSPSVSPFADMGEATLESAVTAAGTPAEP